MSLRLRHSLTLLLAAALPYIGACAPDVAAEERERVAGIATEDPWGALLERARGADETSKWAGSADEKKTLWHPDGIKKGEGAFVRGRKEGPWTFWYETGQMRWQGTFSRGKSNGTEVCWFQNGLLKYVGAYVDEEREGPFLHWYDDGRLAWRGWFRGGERHGLHQAWGRDGAYDAERSGLYERGEKVADLPAPSEAEVRRLSPEYRGHSTASR